MLDQDKRHIALDLHNSYIVVGAVDDQGQVVLNPHWASCAKFAEWAKKHLHPTDAVVLEAGSNIWFIHDLLKPLVARVIVVHAYHVKLMLQLWLAP